MTRTRISVFAMVVAIVAVLALSWLLGIAPQLQQARSDNADRVAADALNSTQLAKLSALTLDRRNVAALKSQLADADAALPATPGLSKLLAELDELQSGYHVHVIGYTATDPAPFGSAASATAAPTGTSPAASASPAPSTTPSTPAPASGASTVPGAKGLYTIPIEVKASGGYDALTGFVGALQSGSRLFVVDKLSIVDDPQSRGFVATIDGFVYVLQTGGAPVAG